MLRQKAWTQMLLLGALTIFSACESKDGDEENNNTDPNSGNLDPGPATGGPDSLEPQPTTPVTSEQSGPGVSPDSCTKEGSAWVAAPGDNLPAVCGDKLAAFKPCLEQVTSRFPGVATAVTNKHKEYVNAQKMLLYAVSDNNGKIIMHYVKQKDAGFQYANIEFTSFKIEPQTTPPECTQDHNAVPGLNGKTENEDEVEVENDDGEGGA